MKNLPYSIRVASLFILFVFLFQNSGLSFEIMREQEPSSINIAASSIEREQEIFALRQEKVREVREDEETYFGEFFQEDIDEDVVGRIIDREESARVVEVERVQTSVADDLKRLPSKKSKPALSRRVNATAAASVESKAQAIKDFVKEKRVSADVKKSKKLPVKEKRSGFFSGLFGRKSSKVSAKPAKPVKPVKPIRAMKEKNSSAKASSVASQTPVKVDVAPPQQMSAEEETLLVRARKLAAKEAVERKLAIEATVGKQQVLSLFDKGDYAGALQILDKLVIKNPNDRELAELKVNVLRKRDSELSREYEKQRKAKALFFREEMVDSVPSESAEKRIKDIRRKIAEKKEDRDLDLKEKERRVKQAEEKIREDIRQRVEKEETEYLNKLVKQVEDSKFYDKFIEYDKNKRAKQAYEDRRLRSLLLRAESLIELDKFEEAQLYVTRVVMTDPYNVKAKELRREVEEGLRRQKERNEKLSEEIFEKEKEEYKRIREQVWKRKIQELMRDAKTYYDEEDYLSARKAVQKVLLIKPKHWWAKRLQRKIERKLEDMKEGLKSMEKVRAKKKGGAVDEAFMEAARSLELTLVKDKNDTKQRKQRVDELLKEADNVLAVEGDADKALVVLNRAYILDQGNDLVVKKIREVRNLKDGGVAPAQIKKMVEDEIISVTLKEKEEAAPEYSRVDIFRRSKSILSSSAKENYKRKVAEFIKRAQKKLKRNDFEGAKKEIERIFLFDKENPVAKDLLERIVAFEANYKGVDGDKETKEAFEKGIALEAVHTQMGKAAKKTASIVRTPPQAKKEKSESEKKTIKKLMKEGKKLYKKERYYEALSKFEAVFAIEANNMAASRYIDKVKEAMDEERKEEEKRLREKRLAEIRAKIQSYTDKIKQLQSQGKYTAAAVVIEKGLLLDPSNKYLLAIKEVNEKGVAEQEKLENKPAERAKHLVNSAIKEYIQGNYIKAKELFDEVLKINPNDKKAQNSIKKIEAKIEQLGLVE